MSENSNVLTNKIIDTTKGVAEALDIFTKAADQRASTFLMGFGALVIVLSIFLKIQLFGATLSSLQPSEFIFLVASGTLFIVLGASMRLYIENKEMDMAKGNRDASVTIVEKSLGIAEKLTENESSASHKSGA